MNLLNDPPEREPFGFAMLWRRFDWKRETKNMFLLLLGCFLSGAAINIIYVPTNISMGGVSGLATILYVLTGKGKLLSLGMYSILLNIPILLLGWKFYGFRMVYRSLIGTTVYSLMIDFTAWMMDGWYEKIIEPLDAQPDHLIFAIFGGVIFGLGLGIIFRGHYTTGGSDILAVIATKRFENMSIGQFLFYFDIGVIALSVITHGFLDRPNIISAMYAFISLFLTGKTTDMVLVGADSSRACYIISDHSDEIAAKILNVLERGVTALSGKGMYTGDEKNVLLVVMSNREVPDLKKLVAQIDERAFIIVTDAKDVSGEGFGREELF